MKLSRIQIKSIYDVLVGLIDIQNVSLALRLREWIRFMEPYNKDFMEVQDKITLTHAKKDVDGNPVVGSEPDTVAIEDPEGYVADMRELYESEVEVTVKPIPESILVAALEKEQAKNPDYPIDTRTLLILSDILTSE